ncbi:unnamed protein product [Coffea canephora]|uniref:MADS-box domain-containing protein n=1 Tax=Coffea canephora TaxID=49390 RepID=A0A068TNU9_COFCA|nr:unnamed protein product [Coffea canephora]
MGRAKLNMELIGKEKSRHITFKKRKEGLMRKIHEFATLCDVDACMIIYGPKQESASMESGIWPENSDEISRMIDTYQGKSKDSATRVFGLQDFFQDRNKRVEDELDKVRKKAAEIQYPTWIDPMSHLSEMELRKFAAAVSDKIEVVDSRMEAICRGYDDDDDDHLHHHLLLHNHHHNHYSQIQNRYLMTEGSQQQPTIDFTAAATSYNNNDNARLSGLIQRGVELELMNHQQVSIGPAPVNPVEMHVPMAHYPAAATIHHQMNENEHHHHHHQVQLGGSASSIQCASFKYYGSSSGGGGGMVAGRGGGVLDNMVYNHPRPLARYYGPSVQPVVAPYVQYPHLMPNVSPQMQSLRENDYNDMIHYRVMDQKPPRH